MFTVTKHGATVGKAMVLGLLMATLLAIALSSVPAGAAVTSGKAFAWGYNEFGHLGNGTHGLGTEKNLPGAVGNLTGVKSVKAGGDHGLALKENGTVWAWGENNYGQLGNETSGPGTDKNLPIKVASLGTGVKAIAAGQYHSLALMKDGTVRSWGQNSDGQLGNGTDDPRDTPGPVSNLSGVKAIATDAAGSHNLALKTDGTVRSWGYNSRGQLGNGASLPGADKTTPVRVANLSNVKAVATGGYHSLAVLESGRARAWGYNEYGQLGNGASGAAADSDVPVAVKDLLNVRNMDGGYVHTLAVAP